MRIPLSDIRIRDDSRPLDAGTVAMLAESMKELGLLNPVSVRERDGAYELCAGHHRTEAGRTLGWSDIEATVLAADDLDAELAMIDENLCRAELSASDRASYTARRKAIYEEKHPDTGHGTPGVSRQVGDTRERGDDNVVRFTADTAGKTGKSERAVQRDAERGEKVADDVMRRLRHTHLDNGVYLDALKGLGHQEQRDKVERDLSAEQKRQVRRKKARVADEPLSEDEARETWLASGVTWWNKGSLEWREQFLARIDTPVMDAGKDDGLGIPAFLRRTA